MVRMSSVKRFDEGTLLFLGKCKSEIVSLPYMHIENPIIKGVANQLQRWPNDFFHSFLIMCFVIGSLVFLVFFTVMLYLPAVADINSCELGRYEDEHPFNVYFVKENTEIWSKREFCYIEAVAREHPKLNIHLVNLLRSSHALKASEARLKTALIAKNINVHINDSSIEEFFSRSQFSSIAKNLSNRLLMIAARAYLLWNSPGVAMDPDTYCNLSIINKSLCKKGKRDCAPNRSASIDLTINLQATEVHCQAFIGFLIREISRNTTGICSLKDALNKFCTRPENCPEVQILNLMPICPIDVSDCPTIYSIAD